MIAQAKEAAGTALVAASLATELKSMNGLLLGIFEMANRTRAILQKHSSAFCSKLVVDNLRHSLKWSQLTKAVPGVPDKRTMQDMEDAASDSSSESEGEEASDYERGGESVDRASTQRNKGSDID